LQSEQIKQIHQLSRMNENQNNSVEHNNSIYPEQSKHSVEEAIVQTLLHDIENNLSNRISHIEEMLSYHTLCIQNYKEEIDLHEKQATKLIYMIIVLILLMILLKLYLLCKK